MKTGEAGRKLIKDTEKLGPKYNYAKGTGRIMAYLCPEKKPTIGYGHTRGVKHSDVGRLEWSMEQAEGALTGDLHASEVYVNSLGANLNANQFDALVSLAFNCGSFGETLRTQLKAGDFRGACVTMKRYVHGANGTPCKGRCGNKSCKSLAYEGLVLRRAAEVKLFNTPVGGT